MRRALVHFRLIVAHPEELRRGKPREGRVRDKLNQLFSADLGSDPIALRLAPLVAPDERRTEDGVRLVEQHYAVHLPGEADDGNVRAFEASLLERSPNSAQGRLPPVLGVLLGPAGLGHPHWLVVSSGRADDMTVRADDHRA